MNKLVDKFSNSYHHSIGKKKLNADYSALTEEIEKNPKVHIFKIGDRVRIAKSKQFF